MLRPVATAREATLRRSFPVSAALQPYVERYWAVRWDRSGGPPFRSEVLSHPSVNLSVEAGTSPRFGATLPGVLLHGVVSRRFVVDLEGAGRVVAAKFRPGGFVALTGLAVPRDTVAPVGPGTWRAMGLAGGPQDLLPALDETDEHGTARLDRALLPLAHQPGPAYDDLRHVLERMIVDRGLVRVEQVAREAGTTTRTLQRLFARYVGLGPKAVLARYRLQDAVATIDAGGGEDLAALATSLGWFDHAHFCRDFRDVVGTTPSAYVARARGEDADPPAAPPHR